jgi:hypothetical protein
MEQPLESSPRHEHDQQTDPEGKEILQQKPAATVIDWLVIHAAIIHSPRTQSQQGKHVLLVLVLVIVLVIAVEDMRQRRHASKSEVN